MSNSATATAALWNLLARLRYRLLNLLLKLCIKLLKALLSVLYR